VCGCPQQSGNFISAFIVVFGFGLAIVGHDYAYGFLSDELDSWLCSPMPVCAQSGAVIRISLATICFFLSLASLQIWCAPPEFHNQAWDLKLVILLSFLGSSILAPHGAIANQLIVMFLWVAGFSFMVYESFVLVEISILVNDALLALGQNGRDDDQWTVGKVAHLLLDLVLLNGSVYVLFVLLSASSSFLEQFVAGLTLVFVLLFTGVQLFLDSSGNLLTTSAMACFVVGRVASSGIFSLDTFGNSGDLSLADASSNAELVLLAVVTCFVSTKFQAHMPDSVGVFSPSSSSTANVSAVLTGQPLPLRSGASSALPDSYGSLPTAEGGLDRGTVLTAWRQALCSFYLLMALASACGAMVVSEWGEGLCSSPTGLSSGQMMVWAHVISGWICALLFTWMLIAPQLFPDRDFS
jgi:hypothetical protein